MYYVIPEFPELFLRQGCGCCMLNPLSVVDMDIKFRRARERLDLKVEFPIPPPLTPEKAEQLSMIEDIIKDLMEQVETLGKVGKVEAEVVMRKACSDGVDEPFAWESREFLSILSMGKAKANMLAHETTPGHAASTAFYALSMTKNACNKRLRGPDFSTLLSPAVSSNIGASLPFKKTKLYSQLNIYNHNNQ